MQKRHGHIQFQDNNYNVIDLGYAEVSIDSFRNLVEDSVRWVARVVGRRVDILHRHYVVAEIYWDRLKGARIRIFMADGNVVRLYLGETIADEYIERIHLDARTRNS